jgi:hypothetical protein
MAKPMFFYAGVYDDVRDADADYEASNALHSGDAIGSYDSLSARRTHYEYGGGGAQRVAVARLHA